MLASMKFKINLNLICNFEYDLSFPLMLYIFFLKFFGWCCGGAWWGCKNIMRLFCSPFLQLLKSFFGFQQILFQTSFLNIEMKSQHKKFSTDKGKSMFACSSYIILSICLVAIAVIMSGSSAAINIIIALFYCSHILIYSIICYPSHPTFHKLSYH